jgi:sterol desaturase/sphingolipid hydroxylase (fatty acid hydroxylase superfamily)
MPAVIGTTSTLLAAVIGGSNVTAGNLSGNAFLSLDWFVLHSPPCFHHWHHAAEPPAIDKNSTVHSTLWDLLFGTYYMPGRWPHQIWIVWPT